MSNIKMIDGANINLDLLFSMTYGEERRNIKFISLDANCYQTGRVYYKTEKEVEARILQILKNQNSEEIEI